jgi:hypothetical protein
VSEFLAIWRGLEEINRRALEDARQAALKVCEVIKERYWGRVEEVSKNYGLRPMLGVGVEGGGSIGYRPVLYLLSDKPRDGELAGKVYDELGGWVGGARLSIVILTEEGVGLERCPYCGTQLLLGAKVTQDSESAEAKSAALEPGQVTVAESSYMMPEASPETEPPAQRVAALSGIGPSYTFLAINRGMVTWLEECMKSLVDGLAAQGYQ